MIRGQEGVNGQSRFGGLCPLTASCPGIPDVAHKNHVACLCLHLCLSGWRSGVETRVNLALYRRRVPKGPLLEPISLRALIRQKLSDGRLPQNSMPRVWGGPSNGETCDGCDEVIGKAQFVIEGVSTDLTKRALQFHVSCFHLWDSERVVPGRDAT